MFGEKKANLDKKPLFLILFLGFISCLLLGSDFIFLIIWWFFLWLIGFIFLPFTSKIFNNFFDNGYLFSKTIGLVFLTFALWLFSILKILPFSYFAILGLLILAAVLIFWKFKGISQIKEIFIYEEALFLTALGFFSFVRGQLPDIHGIEKFMDFAFLNNLLRTKFMPPVDMWLAGNSANYYYYGHYVFAFLTKLTKIPSAITYNLGVATLFAFGFSLVFSLTANLVYLFGKQKVKRVVFAGLISALLLSLGGNLHTFVYAVVLPFAKNIGIYQGEVKPYFYADPRSYIGHYPPTNDKLITEYPAYSYVLGDLHAHIINVCFVLTFIALLFSSFLKIVEKSKSEKESTPLSLLRGITIILMLSVFWMTNTWDFPIYFVVMFFVFLGANLIRNNGQIKISITEASLRSLKILIISLLLLIPFLKGFVNPTQGIHLTRLEHLLSPLYWFQLFVVWGYQGFFVVLFIIFILKKEIKLYFKNFNSNSFLGNLRRAYLHLPTVDIFVLIISFCAIGLVLISEFFYQKDISATDFYRANTVWKVTLQAFVLFDIVVGYIVVRILPENWNTKKLLLGLISGIVFCLPMLYPIWSISQPYNRLRDYKGLDGATFLKTLYPDDYRGIKWLNDNVSGQPVIVEAVGESYTDFARVSVFTGLPTVLGWRVHEWYWRGSFDEVGKRTGEVQEIYESTDINKTKFLLNKYNVSYIFVGSLERQQYP
ncbi:MAG: DUF2298 domain-containing protein, partial [Microgenomates group bacterium]